MLETHLEGLEPLRPLTWTEVFGFWRENEAGNPDWQKHAIERGFASWEEWRATYVAPFHLTERTWRLYRVMDPLSAVPTFHGGPFRAWVEQFYGDAGTTPTFSVIAQRVAEKKNGRVEALLKDFPERTVVTGIETEQGIVIVEGTHRCAAIARAAAERRPIEMELLLALGSALPGPLPIVGGHRKGESPTRG